MRKLFCILGILVSGCSTLVKVPETSRDVAAEDPLKSWAYVLAHHVDDEGRVDFRGLAKDPSKLLNYVNYCTKVGPQNHPEKFPSPSDKLAHYINSYNALSMYNILDSEIPESLSGLKKVKFFFFKKFVIAGEEMSLYAYENDVIRKVGEERVHVALNCMSRGCPRLPKKPFAGATLDKDLDALAKFFFNEDRNATVKTSEQEKVVYLSEILKFYTEDFLKKAPTLVDYVNKYRTKDKLPPTNDPEFTPYDWTVNIWPAAQPSKVSNIDQSAPAS